MAGFYKDYDAQQSSTSPETFWSPTKSRNRGSGRHGHEHGRYAGLGLSDEGQEQVEQLFENVARFRGQWDLTTVKFGSQLYGSNTSEEEPRLRELKKELGAALEHGKQFDHHLWDRHLHFMHKGGAVLPKMRSEFELELCTPQWLDIQLILWTFSVIPAICSRMHSLHLYDTSGGQISSLNHYLRSHRPDCEWAWRGVTWNAYFEGHENEEPLSTDRFVNETQELWYFGVDNTGDIREERNRKGVEEFLESFGNVHLITAAGELPDSKHPSPLPEAQVTANKAQCLLSQITVALGLLAEGGGLIVQVNDLTSTYMLHITYILAGCFHELNLYKPGSCATYDNRCYYVCLCYVGAKHLPPSFLEKMNRHCRLLSPSYPLFQADSVPDSFCRQYAEKAGRIVQAQLKALKEVADLFDSMRRRDKELVNMVKTNVVEKVKTFCKLKKITQDKRVVKHVFLDGSPPQLSIARSLAPDIFSRKMDAVRSLEAIISTLEQRVKHWSSPEELEEDYYMAVAKKPKVEDKRSFSIAARKFITSQCFWEGEFKLEGTPVDIDPEAVRWLQCPERAPELLSLKRGARLLKVSNSPFCSSASVLKTHGVAQTSFNSNPERARELREIEAHFSAAYWYGAGPARGGKVSHFLGKDGLLLASLDLLTDILAPLMSQATSVYSSSEPVDFLDLSGAPGGFSKYICFRTQDSARGWGVVHSEAPVRLRDPEMELYNSWQTFRVLGSAQGMDITKNSTVELVCAQLKRECPTGVKLIIGDSSCSRSMDNTQDEELETKCQFLANCQIAFQLLAKGGSFVCRVYDMYTRFSVGLFFLLYRSFKQVCIVKPFISAPSSNERFIICKDFQGIKPAATKVLHICNEDIHDLKSSGSSLDVLEVVPMKVLFEESFFQFIFHTNQHFARRRLAVVSALEHCLDLPEESFGKDKIDKAKNGIFEVLGISEMSTTAV